MDIPLTKTFSIDYTSPVDGKKYEGKFVARRLSMGDKIKVGVVKSQLTDGLNFDPVTQKGLDSYYNNQAEAIAYCMVALTEKPDWFVPADFIDEDLLWVVLEGMAGFESAIFRPKVEDGAKGDSQDSSGEAGSEELSKSDPVPSGQEHTKQA